MSIIESAPSKSSQPIIPRTQTANFSRWTWHRSTPTAVIEARHGGDDARAFALWQEHLNKRVRPRAPWRRFTVREWPLLWATDRLVPAPSNGSLMRLLAQVTCGKSRAARKARNILTRWLAEAESGIADDSYALECLAWCYALPELAAVLSAVQWSSLLDHLITTAVDARTADVEAQPLASQLLGGELPLAIARLFPEIVECRRLKKPARAFLSASIVDLLAGEALPAAEHRAAIRPLLACWTRCSMLGKTGSKGSFGRPGRRAFRSLLVAAARLTRANQSQFFQSPVAEKENANLLQAAAKVDGSRVARSVVRAVCALSGGRPSRPRRRPAPGFSCERAALAVLSSDWTSRAAALAIAYDTPGTPIDFWLGRQRLLTGNWNFQILVDDQMLEAPPGAKWEEVCWETNRRAQFVEVELDLERGYRMQRSALLAIEDEFLLMADTIVGPGRARIEYAGQWELAANVAATANDETREITLQGPRSLASALPLALPEWLADPRAGRLDAPGGRLVLHQSGTEGSLYAPMFFDFARSRRKQPLTWRQLTVGEDRRRVGRDAAVGYRVQIGKRQWFIYRAVSARGNRSVLGQNLSTELKVGRFLPTGDVKTLMEIE